MMMTRDIGAKRNWKTNASRQYLLDENHVDEAELAEIDAKAASEVEEAQQFAEESPYPDPAELWEHVYAKS